MTRLRLAVGLLTCVLVVAGVAAMRLEQKQTVSEFFPSTTQKETTFALELNTIGNGTVIKTPDLANYAANTVVTLTAAPGEGSTFGGWSGDFEKMKSSLSITMSSDRRITANFWESGVGVIMDETEAELTGWWNSPSKVWNSARYGTYKFAACVAENENSWAIYRPNLPQSGLYDVWIWYSEGENRATNASWEVTDKNGTKAVGVNQTTNGGTWFRIKEGSLFEQGTNGFVRLTNRALPIPSVVVADAVAFVYVGR